MTILFLIIITILLVITIALQLFLRRGNPYPVNLTPKLDELFSKLEIISANVKDDFRLNRDEMANASRDTRKELADSLIAFKLEMNDTLRQIAEQNRLSTERFSKSLEEKISALIEKIDGNNQMNRDTVSQTLKEFSTEQKLKLDEIKNAQQSQSEQTILILEKITAKVEEKLTVSTAQAKSDSGEMRQTLENAFHNFNKLFKESVGEMNNLQRERFGQLENKQTKLVESTERKLDQMREMVDEKLQKTLNERLGQSFDMVGRQLESVQKGLGEMQTLAQDVGGLKKVLSNVKMRGGFGEVQLSMLLENLLSPDQYEANVKIKEQSTESVEFAVKLPNKEGARDCVWIAIDAKFPRDVYETLQTAYDTADVAQIEVAQKNLENTIKKMAREICEKYIDPPNTTDFAIMFLPFEGIYAEVVRKASLLEELQRQCKVVVTGPSTLAALLHSLQMGFRTLAIQKRSSEVWNILGSVKREFETFGGMLEKAQKNIQTASNQLDEVMGKRTRAIQRKLRTVESSPEQLVITDNLTDGSDEEE
jgi:DNA recombination protein RmuC